MIYEKNSASAQVGGGVLQISDGVNQLDRVNFCYMNFFWLCVVMNNQSAIQSCLHTTAYSICPLQLITYGENREEALATMAKALDNYCIRGTPALLWFDLQHCSVMLAVIHSCANCDRISENVSLYSGIV